MKMTPKVVGRICALGWSSTNLMVRSSMTWMPLASLLLSSMTAWEPEMGLTSETLVEPALALSTVL